MGGIAFGLAGLALLKRRKTDQEFVEQTLPDKVAVFFEKIPVIGKNLKILLPSMIIVMVFIMIIVSVVTQAGMQAVGVIPTNTATPTNSPIPTDTATPTNSPIPTDTATPTNSPVPSNTPTPTDTATPTFTETMIPETATALSINMTNTSVARDLTATVESRNATSTQAARQKTSTSVAYWKPYTETAVAKATDTALKAQFSPIDPRELVYYTDNHIDELIYIRGRVFNVNSDTEFQMWINGNLDYNVYIVMGIPYTGLYENDWVTVYGSVYGEECGTNAFGGQVCTPVVIGIILDQE